MPARANDAQPENAPPEDAPAVPERAPVALDPIVVNGQTATPYAVEDTASATRLALSPREMRLATPGATDYAPEHERLLWNIALFASFMLMAWGGSRGGYYALGLVALPLGVLVWSAIRFRPLHIQGRD